MSDMYDDSPEEPTQQQQGSDNLPDWARKQISEANKQAAELRVTLRQRETDLLTKQYEPVIDLLPEEVTSWDSKVAFLEKAKARFDATSAAPGSPDPSSDEQQAPEAAAPAETLAGIVNGPSGSASAGSGMISRADWNQMVATGDRQEAERLFKAGKVNLSDLREGLGSEG